MPVHQHGDLFNSVVYAVTLGIVIRTVWVYMEASKAERKRQKPRLIQMLCIGVLYTYMFFHKLFALGDLLDVFLFVLAP